MTQRPDAREARPLNESVELCVRATTSFSPLFPKQGLLMLGERGLEFRARDGRGFVQVPWGEVELVRVDAYGKFVRSVEVRLADGRSLPLVLSEGARVVRAINEHLGRARLVPARRPLTDLLTRHFRGTGR